MSRSRTLILLGVLIAIAPFIGLPLWLLSWILPVLGLMVLLTGVSLRFRKPREEAAAAPASSFDIHDPIAHQ